jgi:hypothetical protein
MKNTDATGVPAWHVAILLALAAAQIGCGIWTSVASSDTNRDIFFAQQIASGAGFPLTGPGINAMLHLGPLWYYVLAVPLWLIPNAAAVTGAMAAISALQFPLAYALGRRFGSAREGLLFAVALALPGWMNLSLASLTHPIAVVPALLFGVVAALRYRESPDLKRAALVGLACVFMLSAHPTLVLFAGLLVLWSAARTPTHAKWLIHGLVVIGLLALAIAPALYEQLREGFADLATTTRYTQTEWTMPSLSKAAELIYAILYFGPKYIATFVLTLDPKTTRALLWIYGLVLVAAGIGLAMRLVWQPERRGLIIVLLVLLLVQSTFVCAIRTAMPAWMVYAEWPVIAALVALGLEWFCAIGSVGRIAAAAGLLVTTLWSFDVYALLASGPLDHADIKNSPGKRGSADIRDYEKARYDFRLARIPFRQLFAIGDPLCKPVALYGHYAYFVDYTFAVSAAARCGSTSNVRYGGIPEAGRTPLLGLHESAWSRLGMAPETRIGVLGISTPIAIWQSPAPFAPVLPRLTNWPRTLATDVHRATVSGDAPPDQAVLVSHRAHRYLPFQVIGARIDGHTVDPVYTDVTAVVFRAPAAYAGNPTVHWDVDIEAAMDYVDVLTFASAAAASDAASASTRSR